MKSLIKLLNQKQRKRKKTMNTVVTFACLAVIVIALLVLFGKPKQFATVNYESPALKMVKDKEKGCGCSG